MLTNMLKCKIHRARVTHAELHYEGSCAIDSTLMDLAGVLENEQIQIYNVTNGERFTTYAIRGEANSGIISVNGAAAHRADVGDIIIIAAYCYYELTELANHKPSLVYCNPDNTVNHTANCIPVQVI